MLMTFISGAYISGAHFVINRAWALHHKLGQSELLTDPQLRHPDDSVGDIPVNVGCLVWFGLVWFGLV